jgi:hypothetical protein
MLTGSCEQTHANYFEDLKRICLVKDIWNEVEGREAGTGKLVMG